MRERAAKLSALGLKLYTLSRLSMEHRHAQETSEHLLWCPHTPPTPSSHLDLSSPRLPSPPLFLSAPSPAPNTSPVGGVMSGFCGGLLLTGPDNQRVCKCVIYQSFVDGQGFKGRYFYGNCRWSILLYIYVINMWLNLHLTGSFWLSVLQPATSCAGGFSLMD